MGTVVVALLLGYWFFYHTVRGGSFAVYIFGGIHAPLSVKWECAPITDLRVEKKFTLPLLFDEETKNELRGFWYYSYFRQCLYDHGYDFNGNAVPKSDLTLRGLTSTYTNPYGGFSFTMLQNGVQDVDNKLDVDFNDNLFVSLLTVAGETLQVHTFLKDPDYTTFTQIEENLKHLSMSTADIKSKEVVENGNGVRMLRVHETDGTEGIVFMTPALHVIHIFGPETLNATINEIASSLALIPTE